jgi:hypothetical protein
MLQGILMLQQPVTSALPIELFAEGFQMFELYILAMLYILLAIFLKIRA